MSRSKGDGPGFRHFKHCPELNCDYCINGKAKKPYRRRFRHLKRLDIQFQLDADQPTPCPAFIEDCTCED